MEIISLLAGGMLVIVAGIFTALSYGLVVSAIETIKDLVTHTILYRSKFDLAADILAIIVIILAILIITGACWYGAFTLLTV